MAPSLLRDYFGPFQNVLRIVLDDDASRVTGPKEVAPQGLMFDFTQKRWFKNIFKQAHSVSKK